MKKIAIITVHVGQNFGSNLQTIATSDVIKSIGCEPVVVNYIPNRVTKAHYWNEAVSSAKKFIRRVLAYPIFLKNWHLYQDFLKSKCDLSSPIYDEDDFAKCCPQADVYLTGSDQVWNSSHNQGINTRYYYEGIEGKKVSFSSSFGIEKLPITEYEKVKGLLSSYDSISVREDSAKQIIESMGYNATQLLDPTFLLNKEMWCNYMTPRKIKQPYLLIYVPYNIVDKHRPYSDAREIASRKGLKLVTFSWDHRIEHLADITIRFANPGDFLSLIYFADFVITNSFHGTAFSINLNKQFLVYMPSDFGTRINSILTVCKLESRLMTDNLKITEDVIDFEEVNKILNQERFKAMAFLKSALL